MSSALVSVIVPTRNSSRTLEKCLKSIKNQSYSNIEIIVVDQQSNDKTVAIARKHHTKVFFVPPHNYNYTPPPYSRNFGSKFARGKYLLHIDSDMMLTSNVIKDCVRQCEQGVQSIIIPENDLGQGFFGKSKALERNCYVHDNWLETPRFFLQSAFNKITGYDEKMGAFEDWDIFERAKRANLSISRSTETITHIIGEFSLKSQIRKKYHYGLTFREYISKYPTNVTFFIGHYPLVYIKNWKRIMRDPPHGVGMLIMRFCELFAVLIGLIDGRILIDKSSFRTIKENRSILRKQVDLKHLDLPTISVVIPTYNCDQMLKMCLDNLLIQNYPEDKVEIIVIDGGSTDNTVKIAKEFNAKILVLAEEKENPEGRKAIGIHESKNELILLLDSDNILPNKKWLLEMIQPFNDKSIVAAQPLRFHHDYSQNYLNRYFSLIGTGDPVVKYLGKSDHLSWSEDSWNLSGKSYDTGEYYYVLFKPENMPTLGANGYLVRRKHILKTQCDETHFFHIDINQDLVLLGYNKFAFVKNDIIHLSGESLLQYTRKRLKYMQQYYGLSARRYSIYNSNNNKEKGDLLKFILFSLTLLKPTYDSIRGYKKISDKAWFINPIMCLAILATYGSAIIIREYKVFPNRLRMLFKR